MHCAAAEGHLTVFEFLIKEPDADLQSATYDGELLEDVVEDDDLRQKVIGTSTLAVCSLHFALSFISPWSSRRSTPFIFVVHSMLLLLLCA